MFRCVQLRYSDTLEPITPHKGGRMACAVPTGAAHCYENTRRSTSVANSERHAETLAATTSQARARTTYALWWSASLRTVRRGRDRGECARVRRRGPVVIEERDGAVWAQMEVGPALLFAAGAGFDSIQGCGGRI